MRGGLLALLLAVSPAWAAELPAPAAAEIGRLLDALETSGCRFNRNGSWYPAADARGHLAKKVDYLRDKGLLASAEDFITRAGTGSSVSGKPYQVQCGTQPAQSSADWLRGQLRRLRSPVQVP
ncbi:hypothetical protein D0B54_06480 [Solimonas sp. K1W22B-7]|nr:hypothetical protein D0B54_06480 [Solimonas sp. K1W22B-7]